MGGLFALHNEYRHNVRDTRVQLRNLERFPHREFMARSQHVPDGVSTGVRVRMKAKRWCSLPTPCLMDTLPT